MIYFNNYCCPNIKQKGLSWNEGVYNAAPKQFIKKNTYFHLRHTKGDIFSYYIKHFIQLDMSMHHFVIHTMLMHLMNILRTESIVMNSLANVTKWFIYW